MKVLKMQQNDKVGYSAVLLSKFQFSVDISLQGITSFWKKDQGLIDGL